MHYFWQINLQNVLKSLTACKSQPLRLSTWQAFRQKALKSGHGEGTVFFDWHWYLSLASRLARPCQDIQFTVASICNRSSFEIAKKPAPLLYLKHGTCTYFFFFRKNK